MAGLVALGLLVVLGLLVFRHLLATSPEFARRVGHPLPVRTASVTRTDLREIATAAGELRASEVVTLKAPATVRVVEVFVHPGDAVAAGAPLARLETSLLEAAAASARSTLEEAEGELARATRQLERQRSLGGAGRPAAELEKAEAAHAAAKTHVAEGRERLLRSAAALAGAAMTAPFRGVVTERTTAPGELAVEGQKLLALAAADPILATGRFAEEEVGGIRLGAEATVTLDAYPTLEWKGPVSRLGPAADPATRTLEVAVHLRNEDGKLRPGLSAFLRIEAGTADVLVVPSVAVVRSPAAREALVFVVGEDSRAHARPVTLGTSAGGLTAVTLGLREGEQVVTIGQFHLRDGDAVRTGGLPERFGAE